MKSITRRTLLKRTAVLAGGVFAARHALATTVTPRATEGPFYPTLSMLTNDVDNDLVKVTSAVNEAGGEILLLQGRLMSPRGESLAGHRIEIWQCDENGKYLHSSDRRHRTHDSGFQGFGHDVSDTNGDYSFRTIKPTSYPGRTPHIHVKIWLREKELLTTQFYIAGAPENQQDGLFRRMTDEQAKSVSMVFTQHDSIVQTNVDVIV